MRLSRSSGDRRGEAEALSGLGEAFLVAGQADSASARYRAALEVASVIDDRYEQARAGRRLADSYHAVGEAVQAHRHWHQALAIFSVLGTPESDDIRASLARTAGR